MRKQNLITAILVLVFAVGFGQSKREKDQTAIKKMCGCYEVTFNFAETFSYSKDSLYKPSKTKYDYGLEWVELLEDKPEKVVMQHLLIVSDTAIVKHWRQDWLFENTDSYQFFKDNTWKFSQLKKSDVAGKWTQNVYQVDDSPRYSGTSTWVHIDGKSYWKNTTDAPLPRREFTVRNDYNVLKRTNVHEITNYGWLHEQDNEKLIRDDKGTDVLLAREKGLDFYKKVDDSKCLAAQNWWKANKQLWAQINKKWNEVYNRKKDLHIEKTVNKQPMFMPLFELKPQASTAEINSIFSQYIKS